MVFRGFFFFYLLVSFQQREINILFNIQYFNIFQLLTEKHGKHCWRRHFRILLNVREINSSYRLALFLKKLNFFSLFINQ